MNCHPFAQKHGLAPATRWTWTSFIFHFVLRCAALIVSVLTVAGSSSAANVPVTGKVFLDQNHNGLADPAEPGVAAVVSDGQSVVKTSAAGEYRIEVEKAPFVFVVLPRGYRASGSFYAKPDGKTPVNFALVEWPESRADDVRFVQISDVHVGAPGADDATFRQDIREINGLLPKAAFVVATGDLVNRGEKALQLETYRNSMEEFKPVLFNLPGNHDVTTAEGLEHYHQYLGPDYYSFNAGNCHFLLLNSSRYKDDGQQAWIKRDVAAAPPGTTLIVGMHHLPTPEQLGEFSRLGAKAVISGHWHGNRVQSVQGMLDINTPTLRFGGIDRHPRSFRVLEVKQGNVTNELRLGGFHHHGVFAAPAGAVRPGAHSLSVVVNCYDSSVDVVAVGCTWADRTIALTQTGTWSWAATIDVPAGAEGAQSMQATIRGADGSAWEAKTSFSLAKPTSTSRPAVFNLKWVAPAGGFMGFSSPSVGREFVAVGLDDKGDLQHCGVAAFDRSGKRQWFFNTDSGIKNTVAAANGRIFATSVTGWLYALEEATGKLLWKVELDRSHERWEIAATTAADGLVHVGSYAYVAAFDEKTGKLVWEVRHGTLGDWDPRSYTVPVFAKDKILLSHHRWGLDVLNARTGAPAWHLEGRFTGCAVKDDIVFTVQNGRLTALALEDGRAIWTAAEKIVGTAARPVWAEGRILIGTGDGRVCALSAVDGRLQWSYQSGPSLTTLQPYERGGSDVNSTPVVFEDRLYVGASDGEIHAVALADGAKLASYRLGVPIASSPCIANGVLYIGGYDGNVYAFAVDRTGDGVGKPAQ